MALIYAIEDSRVQRELLRRALEGEHQLCLFEDAEAGWEAIAARPPELLVTDVLLPGISGIELCRRVRGEHAALALPVLVVSSLSGLEQVAEAYEAGADDYLLKPVVAAELRAKVKVLLARRQRARAAEEPEWRRYELLERLGQGGQGTIHRARRREACEDAAGEPEVALKVLPRGAPPEAVARLLGEAELLRSLEGIPGIVRVRDVGSDASCAYYAMDLLEGETLRARLERAGRLPLGEAAAAVRALAQTLSALEAAHVVHADLKPENVMLGPAGPVLFDFGLAHRVGAAAPERGGTPAYVAPEVVAGGSTTPRSDLYALGVLFQELLCGRRPYTACGEELAALKAQGAPPELDSLLALDPPAGIVAVVEEALIADPARRAMRAEEVAEALLPYAS